MSKLSKYSLEYHMIIFYVWQLVDYYSNLFAVDTSQAPSETITRLMRINGMDYVRFSFPKAEDKKYGTLVLRMKYVYNQYLRYAILPEQKILKPFLADRNDIYSMVEALYVEKVFEDNRFINLDVIYINSMKAFKHVRKDEKIIYAKDGDYYAESL